MIAATPAITRPQACRVEVLNVRLGPSDGAAGTIYYPIVFTNTGPLRCTLTGYPGVSSVDAQGHQVGAAAKRQPPTPRVVVLAPGRSASAVYGQAQALNYPRSTCRPVTVRALRVYPPNETRWRTLALHHLVCSRNVVGSSVVRPVTPG